MELATDGDCFILTDPWIWPLPANVELHFALHPPNTEQYVWVLDAMTNASLVSSGFQNPILYQVFYKRSLVEELPMCGVSKRKEQKRKQVKKAKRSTHIHNVHGLIKGHSPRRNFCPRVHYWDNSVAMSHLPVPGTVSELHRTVHLPISLLELKGHRANPCLVSWATRISLQKGKKNNRDI